MLINRVTYLDAFYVFLRLVNLLLHLVQRIIVQVGHSIIEVNSVEFLIKHLLYFWFLLEDADPSVHLGVLGGNLIA